MRFKTVTCCHVGLDTMSGTNSIKSLNWWLKSQNMLYTLTLTSKELKLLVFHRSRAENWFQKLESSYISSDIQCIGYNTIKYVFVFHIGFVFCLSIFLYRRNVDGPREKSSLESKKWTGICIFIWIFGSLKPDRYTCCLICNIFDECIGVMSL